MTLSLSVNVDEIIKSHTRDSFDFIWGYANLEEMLPKQYGCYKSGISIGKRLSSAILDSVTTGPTLEYYRHYQDINQELYHLAMGIAADLEKFNLRTQVVKPTIKLSEPENQEYLKNLRTDVSHKMVATRSGLGWIGKTALLINRTFGPRLRLISILMDQPLHGQAKAITQSFCGSCTLCVDACPGQAANGKIWDVSVDRDQFFDAHKCRETCGLLAMEMLNLNIHICGICVAVCPFGRKD